MLLSLFCIISCPSISSLIATVITLIKHAVNSWSTFLPIRIFPLSSPCVCVWKYLLAFLIFYICIFRFKHGCKKQRSRRGLDCFEPSLLKTFSQWQSLMPFLFPPSTDTTLLSLLTPHSYFLRKLKIAPLVSPTSLLRCCYLNVLNISYSETIPHLSL